MVKKFKLSEAAADILSKSVSGGMSKRTDGPSRLPVSVVAGQKEVGEIGTQVTMTTDAGPDGTKGGPTATPPGATPPVGAEPMKRLSGQPAEQGSNEQPEGKAGKQMMAKNKNGVGIQSYGGQNEEIETLDELSVNTLNRVRGAAVRSASDASRDGDEVRAQKRNDLAGRASSQAELKNRAAGLKPSGQHTMEKVDEDGNVIEEEGHEDAKQDKAMMKKMMAKGLKEDIDALLQGEDLSEEFVSKATTIFEAAVMSRVEELAEEVEAQLHEQFEQAVEELKEDFAAKIDDYLNYMVEEWMKENELAIESGLRAEIVEDFIGGLKNLFAEHYIDIPEEKVDVVQEMADKVEELEAKLNEEIQYSIQVRKELNEQKKIQAVQAVCEGLTQTQVEKLKSLAESVEFTTEEEVAEKLTTLKEAYAPSNNVKPAQKSALEEGVEVPDDKPTKASSDPLVNAVVNSISKSVVK
jgi:hypothetical protein